MTSVVIHLTCSYTDAEAATESTDTKAATESTDTEAAHLPFWLGVADGREVLVSILDKAFLGVERGKLTGFTVFPG